MNKGLFVVNFRQSCHAWCFLSACHLNLRLIYLCAQNLFCNARGEKVEKDTKVWCLHTLARSGGVQADWHGLDLDLEPDEKYFSLPKFEGADSIHIALAALKNMKSKGRGVSSADAIDRQSQRIGKTALPVLP